MEVSQLLSWLHHLDFATAIRESGWLFPGIECVHVLAITCVVGSIAIVDLRLIGVTSLNRSSASVASDTLPITWSAFVLAVITGTLVFSSHALGYADSFQFRMKMILLVLAGVNMSVFHLVISRSPDKWVTAGVAPWEGRAAGAVSLLVWISIVAFGRWIGFYHIAG